MNEFDQFIKQKLSVKNYFRYADDFVIVHRSQDYLAYILEETSTFLKAKLDLELHPNKVNMRKFRQGIDFLGYLVLPYHIVLRTKTKRRMLKKLFKNQGLLECGLIDKESFNQSLQSYLGMLKHCDGYELELMIKNNFIRRGE